MDGNEIQLVDNKDAKQIIRQLLKLTDDKDVKQIKQLLKEKNWVAYFEMLDDWRHLSTHPLIVHKSNVMKKNSDEDIKEMDELWG